MVIYSENDSNPIIILWEKHIFFFAKQTETLHCITDVLQRNKDGGTDIASVS
jgi:hypothetical protein